LQQHPDQSPHDSLASLALHWKKTNLLARKNFTSGCQFFIQIFLFFSNY